jgi:hypothetical protein
MLPNERFALACRAWYEEQGLVVDERNGEFAHCPYPEGMGETGYYLLHDHHQQQGILQSKDVGQCCFFTGYAKRWLLTCTYWPDNYFDLWDIYEEFASLHAKESAEKAHEEKNEFGKSLTGVKGGKEAAKRLHEEKDEFGRSVTGVKASDRLNKEKDELGRSINGVLGSERLHKEKNEEGKSRNAVNSGLKTVEQKKGIHGRSPEQMSSDSRKAGLLVLELGVGLFGRTQEKIKEDSGKGGKKSSTQVWESTVDGFRANPGNVAQHNRANGWDPNARIRIK